MELFANATASHRPQSMRFGSLDISYDERVLEPRPWTVNQSSWAAELLDEVPAGPVLELCAGVGHIGLEAVVGSSRDLVLVDLSDVACDHARANVAASGLTERVEIRNASLEEALRPRERFSFVIADPPWVPTAAVGRFPDDPRIAIDGGNDGLEIAWMCLGVIARHLLPAGSAILQLGTEPQARAVRDRLAERPELQLVTTQVKSYEPHGVLMRLARPQPY